MMSATDSTSESSNAILSESDFERAPTNDASVSQDQNVADPNSAANENLETTQENQQNQEGSDVASMRFKNGRHRGQEVDEEAMLQQMYNSYINSQYNDASLEEQLA